MTNAELIGTFCTERHRWESNRPGESDTIVGTIRSESKLCSIKGQADRDELRQGLDYRFFGHWKDYRNPRTHKIEPQFIFNSFVESAPAGREAIASYLSAAGEGLGLGKQRAKKLFDLFGEDAVKTMREEPLKASEALTKAKLPLSAKACEAIAEVLRSKQETEAVQIELTGLLSGRGFPRTLTRSAIQKWGTKAAWIIRRDPYRLMEFSGTGFKKCDAMYLELGLPPDRLKRQALCGWYSISSDSEGHTWFPAARAETYISQNITGANVDVSRALELAIRARVIGEEFSRGVNGPLINSGEGLRWIAEGKAAASEQQIAEIAAKSMAVKHRWPDAKQLDGLSEHQRDQLSKSLSGSIAILGGSPGTGKTHTAGVLIRELGKTFGLSNILVAAPTGKAAVRLTENLVKHDLAIKARTTDSWLNWLENQGLDAFPHSVIVGDESSMKDTDKLARLMRGMGMGCHLLLIGDIYQLPPVGHGAPLRDLIAAGLPYGELREIRRNSGGIVEACAAIRDGLPWTAGDNLIITGDDSPDSQIESMLSICRKARAVGLDPVWDVQVIAAVNEKSPLSRSKLNDILQRELNLSPGSAGQMFRMNDKVVNTENGSFPLVDGSQEAKDEADEDAGQNKKEKPEVYVANGELAKVIDISDSFFTVQLSAPLRIVRVPRGKSIDGGSGCKFDLGYGLTCHKMQGSSCRWVVVMLDTYPGALRVASREWIYTAISRAEEFCYLVGAKATADKMARNMSLQKRKTFLRERVLIERAKLLLGAA